VDTTKDQAQAKSGGGVNELDVSVVGSLSCFAVIKGVLEDEF